MSENIEHALNYHEKTCSCPGAQDARRRKIMEGMSEDEKRVFRYMEEVVNPNFLIMYTPDYDLIGELIASHQRQRDIVQARNEALEEAQDRVVSFFKFLPWKIRIKVSRFIYGS